MTYHWSISAEAGPSNQPDPPNVKLPSKRQRKRRKPLLVNPILPILSFLTPAFASTPPEQPTQRLYPPPPRPTPTRARKREDESPGQVEDSPLVYITQVNTPTHLPTRVVTVDQNVLPYYLTQLPDGRWDKVDNAWRLYGREAGVNKDGVLIGSADNQFAVESSLPKGWGQPSSRTSIYRVPLIVISSVILAVAIVIGIIILVFNRRKAHRKAKRRAERQRRKALIAAGIDPNSPPADTALKEKLAELDKQHRAKKRKEGHAGFARVKVKKWTHGLRRRKNNTKEREMEPETTVEVIEEKPEEEADVPTPSLRSISTVMAGDSSDQTDPTTESSRPTDSSPDESSVESGAEATTTAPYLPPEYRPASVRSYRMTEAGPSTRQEDSPDVAAGPSGTDKTRAPGYYPAPATEDMEEAVAVVSRAEGKRPLPPPTEDEERVRHIATDDKRLLEQMRLGASAPPMLDRDEGEAGPSAPHVEVDQDGFERAEALDEPSPALPLHPDLPAPPRPPVQRSITAEPTDELHLVPSAPPLSSAPSSPSAPLASPTMPSAPPLAPEDQEVTLAAPSAPSFDMEELETDRVVEDGELESEPRHSDTDGPAESPRVFLPKYEP